MNILLPVDGSANSQRAVQFVLRLISPATPPELHLLHVRPPIEAWEVRRFLTPAEIADLQRHEGEEELRACRSLLAGSGLPYYDQVLVDAGEVAEAIIRYADEHGCDLIVMGTHGHSGLRQILMGSVANKVVHLAKVPVTLVK